MPDSRKQKIRNYSFQKSRRLPPEKMTELNGIRVPSMPGSCYHAIICSLAETKDQFVPWNRMVERVEKYMRQYGGTKAWDKFRGKMDVKSFEQRIKDNTHTLTRSGRDCYGFRLHERGMAIYFFKDGAMLVTGGEIKIDNGRLSKGDQYDVAFPDGRGLQVRYRGTTMTHKEYRRFLEHNLIDASGKVLSPEGVRTFRSEINKRAGDVTDRPVERDTTNDYSTVTITLEETYNQETAARFEALGVMVCEAKDGTLIAMVPSDKIDELLLDEDVIDVEVVEKT